MKTKTATLILFALQHLYSFSQNKCDSLTMWYGLHHFSSALFIKTGDYYFAGDYQKQAFIKAPSLYITKTDSCGKLYWEKNFFDDNKNYLWYNTAGVDQNANGDIFSVMYVDSSGSDMIKSRIDLHKINMNGNVVWNSTYTSADWDNVPYCVGATKDGGAVAGGWQGHYVTYPNLALLIKFSKTGTVEWSHTYGNGEITSVKQTADGGYTFIIYYVEKNSFTNAVITLHSYLCKTDKNGNLAWKVETPPPYKNKAFDQYRPYVVFVSPRDADTSYLVVRTQGNNFVNDTIFVTKYNSKGKMMWNKYFNYFTEQEIASAENTLDGGYLLTGRYNKDMDTTGVYMIKLKANGDTAWTKRVTSNPVDIFNYPQVSIAGTNGYQINNSGEYVAGAYSSESILRNGVVKLKYSSVLIKFNDIRSKMPEGAIPLTQYKPISKISAVMPYYQISTQ